jgi:hypothetical protein
VKVGRSRINIFASFIIIVAASVFVPSSEGATILEKAVCGGGVFVSDCDGVDDHEVFDSGE